MWWLGFGVVFGAMDGTQGPCMYVLYHCPVVPAPSKMRNSPLEKPVGGCQDDSEGQSACHAILIMEFDLRTHIKEQDVMCIHDSSTPVTEA